MVEKESGDGTSMSGAVKKIVVRGVNWLGDAIMTTPALLRLREAYPNAAITIVTPEKLADLWNHHPAIDDVLAFTPKETVLDVGRRIRWGNFDLGIVFPNSPRSAIEMWLGGVKQRVGYSRAWRNLFLTTIVAERVGKTAMHKRSAAEINRLISTPAQPNARPVSDTAHQIHDYLQLVAVVGANPAARAPNLSVTEEETRELRRELIKDTSEGPDVFFGINPGAEYGPAKRWPKERFISAATIVQKRTPVRWLILGGPGDSALAEEIATGIRAAVPTTQVTNLAGRTSLRRLCVATKLCRVVLTNDTGPAHVAAAVGTPVVIPFGSTSPELTAPGFPELKHHRFIQSKAPCSPCFLRQCPIDFRCMESIDSAMVADAVLDAAQIR